MKNNLQAAAAIVEQMDKQLRNDLFKKGGEVQKKKLWENTYAKHQIDKRNNGGSFSVQDHVRAMVYSMLTSGISWDRVESGIDLETGRILPIDEIFGQYDTDYLLNCDPAQLGNKIFELHYGSPYTMKQMKALVNINIRKLLALEEQYGSLDKYYETFTDSDHTVKSLVRALSDYKSKDAMGQLGVALAAEYLKNVGYDIAKPDRHITRILGSNRLALSNREEVPDYKVFDIVAEIAKELNRSVAEVDYILWAYCAKGYGEICTKINPKCELCAAKSHCINNNKK